MPMDSAIRDDPIRIMICDDHPLVRYGFRVVLESYPDLALVAEATNGEQAVSIAQQVLPDVMIMDIQMPVMDGIAAIQQITQANPTARILVLTSFPDDDNVFRAIRAGAMGFLLKDSSPDQLIESIRAVHRGEVALHPSVARKLMQEIKQPPSLPLAGEQLTPRELDVLRCLARGETNQEIARTLTVSVRTVTTHVRNILEKLHLANRTQAALYAVEQGISDRPKQ